MSDVIFSESERRIDLLGPVVPLEAMGTDLDPI
jgi:hypothetical protein